MVVDTSAILAIIFNEYDAAEFRRKIATSAAYYVSAATLLGDLSRFLAAASHSIVPFDEPQYRIADKAFARYGRGSGHPAQLNLGDCFAYALAKHLDVPLLFKGNDFIHTDLVAA